jgi:hypothetical protein
VVDRIATHSKLFEKELYLRDQLDQLIHHERVSSQIQETQNTLTGLKHGFDRFKNKIETNRKSEVENPVPVQAKVAAVTAVSEAISLGKLHQRQAKATFTTDEDASYGEARATQLENISKLLDCSSNIRLCPC